MPLRILLVEHEPDLAESLVAVLEHQGHVVDHCGDGLSAWTSLSGDLARYELALVDWMVPQLSGIELCRRLRAAGFTVPVLLLTARDATADRVEGLEAGADDYLVKPFAFSELAARLAAVTRRPASISEQSRLVIHDLEMDLLRRTVSRDGTAIELLPKEFALLEYFMHNEGRVLSRTMLLERVWDFHFDPQTTVVETHISRLRAKIDKPFGTPLLHTIKNVGYSLRAPD